MYKLFRAHEAVAPSPRLRRSRRPLTTTRTLSTKASGHVAYELERAVCERPPDRPSLAIDGDDRSWFRGRGAASSPVARSRGCRGATELRRRLRDDLDAILTKALRKTPDARYGSVEQLAADVRHHLAGRVVRAHQGHLVYRLGKLLRRRQRELAAAAVALLFLAGFLADRARQQRQTLRERDKLQLISSFFESLFENAAPYRSGDPEMSVRELLDRGAGGLDQLSERPEIQAAYMTTLGDVYRQLGFYDKARSLLERALALRRVGNTPLDVAESLAARGELHLAQ